MRCPYCLNDVVTFLEEKDASGRPVLVCPDATCREAGVPLLYVQEYDQYHPIPFSIVGLRGHGKSVFVSSLFHEFERLGERWPDFYSGPLDEDSMREIRKRLVDLAGGKLPEATRSVFPRAHVMRLDNIPRVGGCHLMMFDTSGEAFRDVNGIMAYGRYVRRSPAVVWLISLEDLGAPDELNDFLTVYLQALAEMNTAPGKQELIVVLTKGDLLLKSAKLAKLPESASNFLLEHDLDPRTNSWSVLEKLSEDMREYLARNGFHQFVNRAGKAFAAVRFAVVSAQGTADVGGSLDVGLMPRGVLAPLFWLWRTLAPPVWVDAPDGKQLFFSLEDALRDAPSGSAIQLNETTYHLQAPLQVRHSIRLQGRGIRKTVIVGKSEGYDIAFGSQGGRFEASDITFRHEGTKPADVFRAVRGEVVFHRCGFSGGIAVGDKNGTGDGLILAREVSAAITECEFLDNQGSGLSIRDRVRAKVEGNQMRGNQVSGIFCCSSESCTLIRNVCNGNRSHGIRVGENSSALVENNICQKNQRSGLSCADNAVPQARANDCQENGLSGIQVKNQSQPTLESNRCQDNQASGIVYSDAGAGVARKNLCTGNSHCGISLTDSTAPELVENICQENVQHGLSYVSTSGGSAKKNNCTANSGCGIQLEGQPAPTLEENICHRNKSHGLSIASTVGKLRLKNNDCRGNGGKQVRDDRDRGWFG
jgi:parallel beta-helix repeat protein